MKGFSCIVAAVSAAALVFGMAPCSAYASVAQQKSQQAHAEAQSIEQRAQQIDANADAYADGAIIVVYREGSEPAKQAESGLSVQSVSVAGIPDATQELLSEESGVAGGGAAVHVDIPQDVSVGEAVARAERDPNVLYAQPIFQYHLLENETLDLPDDPVLKDPKNSGALPNAWWIYSTNVDKAWETAHANGKVTVAVLDTGIDFTHRDLRNNILSEYAYDSYLEMPLLDAPTRVPTSEMDHGSHVAGIVAAEANNGFGIAGASYNANILPICVFHESETTGRATCSDEDLIRAYDYLLSDPDGDGVSIAAETNTHVVNMSLGGYIADDPNYEYDYVFEAKIEQAQEEAGILTVAAGGNGDDFGNARTDESYPSDYDAVMAVTALKNDTQRTTWSDYNSHKNIAAPGADIYSCGYYDDKFTFKSGTSMAAPLVSGIAALLWAYDPSLTVDDVKRTLYSTAVDLGATGYDYYYGWGRVDAEAAVKSLGTASVKAESNSMMRTAKQQMTASSIANPDSEHSWVWTVVDPDTQGATSRASISSSGMLTAREAGSVEVHVTASDDATLEGKRVIEITEIEIPGGISASANPSENTIALRWSGANAASSYRVMRSLNQNGPFTQIDEVEASEITGSENTVTYLDRTAQPAVNYWYQVIPMGTLDTESVEGLSSNTVKCYYTDKSALKAQITAAEDLLSATKTSTDGSDIRSDEMWSIEDARSELNAALRNAYTSYYNGVLLQAEVDEAAATLKDAVEVFEAVRKPGLIEVTPKPDPQPDPQVDPDPKPDPKPDADNTKKDDPNAGKKDPVPNQGNAEKKDNGNSAGQKEGDDTPTSCCVMLRLYNPNSGEHFYTSDTAERDALMQAGWNYEGEAWTAPVESNNAVYRLYNPNAGDHHYTMDVSERNDLVALGWNNEGIGWFSDDAQSTKLYRLYNPNALAGSHHYTTDEAEISNLVGVGWHFEGVGWYGM